MSRDAHPSGREACEPASARVRRFRPRAGQLLTLANIRGSWRPSGTVAGSGMFAVVWSTWAGTYWAALHDFAPADQLRLIEACRHLERAAGYQGLDTMGARHL